MLLPGSGVGGGGWRWRDALADAHRRRQRRRMLGGASTQAAVMGRAAQRGRSTCLGAGEGALQQSRTRAGMLSGAGFGRAGRGAPFRVEGFGFHTARAPEGAIAVERYSGEKVQQQNKQRRIAIVAFLNHLRENEQQQLQQHHHHHRQ